MLHPSAPTPPLAFPAHSVGSLVGRIPHSNRMDSGECDSGEESKGDLLGEPRPRSLPPSTGARPPSSRVHRGAPEKGLRQPGPLQACPSSSNCWTHEWWRITSGCQQRNSQPKRFPPGFHPLLPCGALEERHPTTSREGSCSAGRPCGRESHTSRPEGLSR